jgi:hypothetical protein
VRRFQIHKGYAARLTPRLTQKSTAQPLAFLLHGYGLAQRQHLLKHFFRYHLPISPNFSLNSTLLPITNVEEAKYFWKNWIYGDEQWLNLKHLTQVSHGYKLTVIDGFLLLAKRSSKCH